MNFSRFFIDRPIFAAVLSSFLVLAGLAAMRALPIAQYPEIAPPVVTVRAFYPGASAQTIEQTVAAPLENQLTGVEDMIFMSSNSGSNGLLEIQVTFGIGADADKAALNVNNRVKQPGLLVDVAGEEGGVGVAVHAADEGGDVDVDDVAVLDDARVRDAVADDLVDARAQRLREAAVAEGRGVGAVVAEELVADPVELVGGHTWYDVGAHQLTGLGGEPAGDAHPLDRLGVLDLLAGEARGRGAVDVLGTGDVGGHDATR